MRPELMTLTDQAVRLLADVAAGEVWLVEQRTATYAMNGRTGKRVTKSIRYLKSIKAIEESDRMRGGCWLYRPTPEGREALGWHRPDLAVVVVTSFGYGHGGPPGSADLVVDVRESLRNPHRDPGMRQLTGRDAAVREHVMATPGVRDVLIGVVRQVVAYEVGSVAFGCVGGRHRSVVLADTLGALLESQGRRVGVEHRDVDRPVLPARAVAGHCPACRDLDGAPAAVPCPVHATPAGDAGTGSSGRTMAR